MVGNDFIFWNDDLNFKPDINKEEKKDILNKDKGSKDKDKENYVSDTCNSRR